MAKKKAAKNESKSDFLRRTLAKHPEYDYDQALRRWTKEGHAGTFSTALYYQVRAKMGIRSVWTREPASGPTAPGPPARASGEVYEFKVILEDSQPVIWRQIQVRDCALDTFHGHIQTAMGWTNSHLHHFQIGGRWYGDPSLMGDGYVELEYVDTTRTLLSDILPGDDRPFAFLYEYDFGDSWQHRVEFRGRVTPAPGARYPVCVGGERACPPEDVGGVWGYADFVEAITDPEHPEHDALKEWVGGSFDPERFDPREATRAMTRGLPDWRSMR